MNLLHFEAKFCEYASLQPNCNLGQNLINSQALNKYARLKPCCISVQNLSNIDKYASLVAL